MNSPNIRKFCHDTCHWTQQLPIGYNLGNDKKIPVSTEIGFCKLKSGLRQCLNGGHVTFSIAIYFSLKNSCRNRKNSVTTLYFSEFCHDQTFNVVT